MRNCNKLLLLACGVLALSACGDKARIRGTLAGAPDRQLIVKQLDVNTYRDLDPIKTAADGSFRYTVPVAAGQPEFIYLYDGETRVAALLLEKGETATVQADTLGRYSVTGSAGSEELARVDKAYADFLSGLQTHAEDPAAMSRLYLQHYRDCLRYVMEHPYSLTTVPVFFERLGDSYIFSQLTDAIIFRRGADSLLTAYPDSRYTQALDREAERRMRLLELDGQLNRATERSFPDITLPDTRGESHTLSEVDAKVILVHFWDAGDTAQKIMNLETLMPLYEEFHGRGFEIYSVCVSAKPVWAATVLSQKLPWINVNDGLGGASPAVLSYNVSTFPGSYLIVNGELYTENLSGTDGLRRELRRLLRK